MYVDTMPTISADPSSQQQQPKGWDVSLTGGLNPALYKPLRALLEPVAEHVHNVILSQATAVDEDTRRVGGFVVLVDGSANVEPLVDLSKLGFFYFFYFFSLLKLFN